MHSNPQQTPRRPSSRRFLLAVLAGVVAVVLAACGTELGQAGSAAVVNGEEIPVAELEQRYEEALETPQVAQQMEADPEATRRQLEAQLLTQLVQSRLLRQGAAELGVEVSDEDVAEQRQRIVDQVGGEEAFQSIIEQNGFSEEQLDELLRDLALQEKIADHLTSDLEATDEQVQAYYEENYGGTATARHILVETQEEAQEVVQRLEAGEDFAEVASDVSTDPGSAARGGELGEISRGQTVPEFEEAVFGAEVGEIVGPVETQFGFHVIEVTGQQDAPPLEDVREEVVEQVLGPQRQQAVQQWLQERVDEADVTVNPRFGEWNPEQGRVVPAEPLGEVTEQPGATEPEATQPATTEQPETTGEPAATEAPTDAATD